LRRDRILFGKPVLRVAGRVVDTGGLMSPETQLA